MEETAEIVQLYSIMVIMNIFITMLLVKLFSYFFAKAAYPISKEIIRWIIISYGIINAIFTLINALTAEENALSARATGPYAAIYWLVSFFSCLLPLVLLFKKFKNKGWAIFGVAFLINTGWIFERYVILITSLHRDYLPSGWSMYGPFTPLITSILRGTLLAIFITAISIVVMKYQKTRNIDANAL